MKFRDDIQFLRGLAVLAVVLFHLQIPFFNNGFLGVDVFFVISGFLMALLYDKGTALDFYKRRLDRLYPAYAITLFVTLIAGTLVTIPVDFSQLYEQAIAGTFFVSNIFYWNENSYFDKTAFNPLLNLWSLAVEVQFYLIVPFLYPLLRRRKWLFLAVFFVSLASCLAIQTVSPKTSFFMMPLRVWEFLIGAWVAWWGSASIQSRAKQYPYISLVLIVALVVSLFMLKLKPESTGTILYGHPAFPALVVTLLTGLLITFGIHQRLTGNAVGRFITKTGDYSYSIYLVHFPLIVLFNYVPFGGTRLTFDSYSMLTLAVLSIVTASLFSYFIVEKKLSSKINHPKFRTLSFVLILASAYTLNIINLYQFNDAEKNIFSAWTDRDVYRCGKVFRILNPTDIICNIGTGNGNKKILLVGNSHADSIKKVFADNASVYGISTYFVVSNDPLIGSGPNAESLILEAIKHDINEIVVHFSNVYDSAETRAHILKLIELANEHGIKVDVIAPVPTYDVHIPQAMFKKSSDSESFTITKNKHLKKTQQFQSLVPSFEALGANVFDPSEYLCPQAKDCLFSNPDTKPFYFDAGHLTLTGASVLTPLFQSLLKGI